MTTTLNTHYKNNNWILWIILIFESFHNTDAVTPVKYGGDIQLEANILTITKKNGKNNGMDETGFVKLSVAVHGLCNIW